MQRVIGIDPGLTGAVARLTDDDGATVDDMPVADKQVLPMELCKLLRPDYHDSWLIVIERQQAFPRDGRVQAFRTGFNYGVVKAVAMMDVCRVEIISAAVWKKEFGLLKKDKGASRLKAIELFPELADRLNLGIHHGRAEALLIAEYGRRKFN
jgi:crossover junction endodeoxyribonuclease RuvC